MDWKEMILYGYESAAELLEKEILRGLNITDMNVQPHADCNSIGWTVWHLTRLPDDVFSALLDQEQLWISGGWYQKFKREDDPTDTGFGHTTEQVRNFWSPSVRKQMEYHKAVLERVRKYIKPLKLSDLDNPSDVPWSTPNATISQVIQDVLTDIWLHTGEASYIKGLLKAQGRV
jgi:hypothetical protein